VNIAGSGEASDFKRVPDTFRISSNLAYVHFTSNETSLGTQFAEPPNVDNTPVVCDACSDLFSRRLDIRRYGMIYASAQKNLGTAGVTLVIIHQDLVERGAKHLPTILQYRTHVSAASRYNTPPVFAMLIMNRMLRWISQHGGLAGMEEMNNRKSAIVYDGLDRSPLFRGMADASCRSMVSATFTTGDRQQDERFAQFAESRGLMNLRGHRSVGGLRASLYNGMAIYGAERLVDAMREFETSVAHETNSPTAP
jgi:phosphoserine aminotransferase